MSISNCAKTSTGTETIAPAIWGPYQFYIQKLKQLFHTHTLPMKVFPQSYERVLHLCGSLVKSGCGFNHQGIRHTTNSIATTTSQFFVFFFCILFMLFMCEPFFYLNVRFFVLRIISGLPFSIFSFQLVASIRKLTSWHDKMITYCILL